MNANFEAGYNALGEMPTEDSAGIGFGISVLVVVSMLAGLRYRSQHPSNNPPMHSSTFWLRAALIAPWLSLLAYCMKTGMVTPARLIAPYYPLLLPALLIGAGQIAGSSPRLVAGGCGRGAVAGAGGFGRHAAAAIVAMETGFVARAGRAPESTAIVARADGL